MFASILVQKSPPTGGLGVCVTCGARWVHWTVMWCCGDDVVICELEVFFIINLVLTLPDAHCAVLY